MRFLCPLCGKIIETYTGLILHVRCRHLNGGYCPVCGRRFKNLANHASTAFRTSGYTDVLHALVFLAARRRHWQKRTYEARLARSLVAYALRADVASPARSCAPSAPSIHPMNPL